MSVGPPFGPVERASDGRDFAEIFRRLDVLERTRGGGWIFNFDNEGGWGYVQFNDSFDLDDLPDPLGVGGTWSAVLEEAGGDGFLIGSTTLLRLESGGGVRLGAGGLIEIKLATGQSVTVLDNASSPIFRVDEDGDLHGKTGKALTFDL